MVKRDPCWSAKKKAVRQETNHLDFSFDFSFRFKDVFLSCKNLWAYIFFQKTLYVIFNIRKTLTIEVIILEVFQLIFFSLVFVCGLNVSKGRTIRKVIGGWGFLWHEFCFGQVRSSYCV